MIDIHIFKYTMCMCTNIYICVQRGKEDLKRMTKSVSRLSKKVPGDWAWGQRVEAGLLGRGIFLSGGFLLLSPFQKWHQFHWTAGAAPVARSGNIRIALDPYPPDPLVSKCHLDGLNRSGRLTTVHYNCTFTHLQ